MNSSLHGRVFVSGLLTGVLPSSCCERKQGLSVLVDEILNNEQIIISE